MRCGQKLVLLPLLLTAQALPAQEATSPAHAQMLYVIETLVVNVNSAPDASGTRIATIKSGDAVEVLDKQGEQIHVKLANGTEGWIRKSYLSEKESLQHRLDERGAEVENLKKQLTGLQEQLTAARTNTEAKTATSNTTARGKPKPAAPVEAPPAADPPASASGEAAYFMTPPETPARPVWHWALGSFVVALALGFALGWQVLDRRIRRKYGGLRIY